ncbi:MAG: AmmeMemoRadiSam system protein B [Anaerolineae bacterium]|nr:AmmeMemoRadiSam system protein B [Anaerolineae bacterium]
MTENPKLRPLDYQPVYHLGQQMWYLHDPLQLTHYQLVMPPALAQMLLFMDGSRDAAQIHQALCQHLGVELEAAVVLDALAQMDEACLLDNARSQQRLAAARGEYRAQPYRPPALAKTSYPEQPTRLSALFAEYGRADNLNGWQPWHGRGLISPHIDYPRGGPVYAKVWQRARQAVLDADLVIIFGTDHKGGLGTFTLTRQHYATPYGVIPTDLELVDRLAAAIGPEKAFAEELHHRNEHSIELSAVWLHHMYHQTGVTPKPLLPVLVGSFHHFMMNGHHPAQDDLLLTALETLKRETAGRKVLAIASVDFAHVGPAFGDEFVMDDGRRAALRQADDRLVQAIIRGDAAGFYEQITAVQDQNRICGFSPIYLLLQYLGSTEGVQVAYDHCPADAQNHSLVSIAGVLLE